jgi:phosphoribosylformylglycinamidine cyclo-ligase
MLPDVKKVLTIGENKFKIFDFNLIYNRYNKNTCNKTLGVNQMGESITYADAGVDIDKANDLVGVIKKLAKSTPRTGVMGEIGGFGGLYSLNLSNCSNPVLVSSTDGVGTKLKIAFKMDRHDTIGIDLVAMCVNDIVVQGAKPLFFLDYLAMGALDNKKAASIIEGIAKGCCEAQCALIGGETAEMPGMYQDGEYDLSGFSVGIVDNAKIIDGSEIRNGHKLIGIASSGVHSNGFSLVRKICFDACGYGVDTHIPDLGKTLGEELITPTRIYCTTLLGLARDLPVHGLAHITGGGIDENIIRVIPDACKVNIFRDSWDIPPVFTFLQKAGNVTDREMHRTFNNGIGMMVVVPEESAQEVLDRLSAMDEQAFLMGEVASREASDPQVEWV